MQELKRKAGQPKKEPTFKPSLRCRIDKWKLLQEKYPGKVNKIFNEWIDSMLSD